MTGRILYPVLAALVIVAWAGCSSNNSRRVRESAADGGPEDPAILAVEKLGGSCFRANWVRETHVERDRLWFQEV